MIVDYKTTGFTADEIRQAALLQIRELNQGFLSSLGEAPVTLIFAHAAASQWGLLAMAKDGEKVIGYVLGATDTGQFYKDFLIRRFFSAAYYFLPKMLSWERIRKAVETLLYPSKRESGQIELPPSELLDLAVDCIYHGSGVAQELFEEFVGLCRSRGVTVFQIPTTEGLDRAHRFYEKMGARKVASIEVHKGQQTHVYQYKIEEM